MLPTNRIIHSEENTEILMPYEQLRRFVMKILKRRISTTSDVEDVSQDILRRGWQWSERNNKKLSLNDWKRLLAKISFNEINRFYSKQAPLLEGSILDEQVLSIVGSTICPQFILEIAEELYKLPLRQRLAIILNDGEILVLLKVVLPNHYIAELLEISEKTLSLLESEIPLSETRIIEIIENLTQKECKSSIRDERCKGRKSLRRRLFGK